MSRTAVRLLKDLRVYLRNIDYYLLYVDFSDEEYQRRVNPRHWEVRASRSTLLSWRGRIDSLVKSIENRSESGDEEALLALEQMQSVATLVANERFEKYEPILMAVVKKKVRRQEIGRQSGQTASKNRLDRDDYIRKRSFELKKRGFKGNAAVKITLELRKKKIKYSSQSTVERILAGINKPPSDSG